MNPTAFQTIELPDDLGVVTLYDWMGDEVRDGRNLVRTDADGLELWRAKPPMFGDPRLEDCFVRAAWDGSTLTASTWTGYRVAIDVINGAVTVLEFTK